MTDVSINVPEIHCGHCKSSIESAVIQVSGVDRVNVAIADRTVQVSYDGDSATYSDVVQSIEGQGYTVEAKA